MNSHLDGLARIKPDDLKKQVQYITSYSKWLVKMEFGKHDCTFIQMTWYTSSEYALPSMTLTRV